MAKEQLELIPWMGDHTSKSMDYFSYAPFLLPRLAMRNNPWILKYDHPSMG
jgi:hypothetical protein